MVRIDTNLSVLAEAVSWYGTVHSGFGVTDGGCSASDVRRDAVATVPPTSPTQ